MLVICLAWIMLVGGSFLWNYAEARKLQKEIAFQTAKGFFDLIVITRTWNSQHGGVYVPVTDSTRPNQYLNIPLREIQVNKDTTLTKINPAFMTRQISEIAAAQKGIQFHLTSLVPIRPENKPTQAEIIALEAFQKGKKEVGYFIGRDDNPAFFYMAPLITEKSCLDCHAKQGYKEGEIRGGISITLPFTQKTPVMTLVTGHLGIGLAGILGIIIFGIQLERYYEILKKQSVIDALTGIPNRRSFSDTILREFGRSKRENLPISIIMCDVDKFKDYNDNYGHEAGDNCLKIVAQAIEKTLNRPNDFCARYGGEEFVIVLPNSASNGALRVAEKVRASVEAMGIVHATSEPLKVVTISLGVATVERDMSISNEDLIRFADKALYRAKDKGRNRVEIFDELE